MKKYVVIPTYGEIHQAPYFSCSLWLIAAASKRVRVARAPAGLPFRWTVADAERRRSATSVTGVLRHVRAALDSGYRSVSLRIAPLPPAP